MKELSIEQKAKRYDEAIEKAKEYFNSPRTCFDIEQLCNIFPELTESEDERIRKRIIHALHGDVLEMSEIKEAVDWLEKQGNLMKALQISNAKIGELIEKNYYLKEQLEKQGEQKPTDKVESRQEELTELEKAVKQVMEEAIECGDTHNLKADAEMLLSLVHKSAWSKEDEEMVEDIIEAIDTQYAVTDYNEMVSWLKSLKDRFTWKPSDEQMNALNDVISSRDIKYDVLSELWKDLKKLKE